MKCSFDIGGTCQGKYKGFGCIEHKCDHYEQRCEYLADSYCLKYKRFFCAGSEDCSTFENYLGLLKDERAR